ncbi:hypothetical protein H5410_025468 [Solanum commersonii]|uniref:Uncharacterized protein n=1 Tax=Solanum commersonii TaxID=4109 RepID=A0A9J5YVZ2_SOLCO|nr:hypothetical protein H5410_025468 [Solanum commersonii]
MTRKCGNSNTSSSSNAKSDGVSNNQLTVTIEMGVTLLTEFLPYPGLEPKTRDGNEAGARAV